MDFILNTPTALLGYELYAGKSVNITVGTVILIALLFAGTYIGLQVLKKAVVKIFAVEDNGRLDSIFNFANYFVYVIIFFSMLNMIGVNINMFLTTSAALFVGLGFALQKIFQDLIAGIYILLDKTLRVGDIIEIEGKVAKIKVINLRSTIAETRNRRIIVIPNRRFVDDVIDNWTQDSEVIRASVEVGVYLGTDVQKVREVLLDSVTDNADVLKEPAPLVMLDRFGESSVRFHLHYFINNSFDNDKIASDIRFAIDKQFKEHNIKLPIPVLRVQKEEYEN